VALSGKPRIKLRIILLAIIALLTVWSLTVLVFLPQRDRLTAMRAQCRRELQEVRCVEVFTLEHPDVEAYLTELDQKGLFLDKMLPAAANLEDYLAELETAARQSGVRLGQVQTAPWADNGHYQELRLEVSIQGSFYQMLHFLKQLEEGPRFSMVSGAVLHASPGTMDGKLDIRIFSLKK
jgi:Tfp pilus assembly protein PilO